MSILTRAAEIVDGARQKAYGHPRENHGCTAELWTSYLRRRGLFIEEDKLDARDICMMNILQKVSRDANAAQEDNLVDIAGFARNAEMVGEEEPVEVEQSVSIEDIEAAIRAEIIAWRVDGGDPPGRIILSRELWERLGKPRTMYGLLCKFDADHHPDEFELSRRIGTSGVLWEGTVRRVK